MYVFLRIFPSEFLRVFPRGYFQEKNGVNINTSIEKCTVSH